MERLRLTSPMMTGPAVKRLQEMLGAMRIDVGADGIFGRLTEAGVLEFQRREGLSADGVVGEKTWEKLSGSKQSPAATELWPTALGLPKGVPVYDRHALHAHPKNYHVMPEYNMKTIVGVTLHQTGCRMPDSPAGWDHVNAHFGIPRQGGIILINPFTDFIWHAQQLSLTTFGVEIDGNFPGIEGDPKTLWSGGGPAATLTPEQELALDALFGYLLYLRDTQGFKFQRVHAHRQSSPDRVADPGSEIWRKVALKWMAKEPSLSDGGPTWRIGPGRGRTIPRQWNPEYPDGYSQS